MSADEIHISTCVGMTLERHLNSDHDFRLIDLMRRSAHELEELHRLTHIMEDAVAEADEEIKRLRSALRVIREVAEAPIDAFETDEVRIGMCFRLATSALERRR